MESHKTYQAINPVELAKISQELIVKNKTAYEHLATGLPVQQILDEIIPKLIKLYKGHVVQIVQFETDLKNWKLFANEKLHSAKMLLVTPKQSLVILRSSWTICIIPDHLDLQVFF